MWVRLNCWFRLHSCLNKKSLSHIYRLVPPPPQRTYATFYCVLLTLAHQMLVLRFASGPPAVPRSVQESVLRSCFSLLKQGGRRLKQPIINGLLEQMSCCTWVRAWTSCWRRRISFLRHSTSLSLALNNVWEKKNRCYLRPTWCGCLICPTWN